MSSNSVVPVIVEPGHGRVLRAFGEEVTILLDGSQTGGQFVSILEVTPPGGGPPPHYHDGEDEFFYVLEGRMSFFSGGLWKEVPVGATFYAPRKSVHTFKNVGDAPSRMLVNLSPCGFENFFAEAAAEFAKPGGPDMAKAMTIAAKHGIHFV